MLAARLRPIALLALLAPAPAVASTLTFDGIEAFFNELTAPHPGDAFGWAGTYFEGDYAVDVFANAASREVRDGQLGIHDGSGGAGTLFSDVAIRRTDGQSFILESFEVSAVMSNYFGLYEYQPAGADMPALIQAVALQWPNLELIGTRSDGSTVSARLAVWRDSIDNPGTLITGLEGGSGARGVWESDPDSPFYTPDLARPFTSADFGTGFRDLDELRVNMVRPASLAEILCSPATLSRLDPVFAALSACTGSVTLPDGSFVSYIDLYGPRNDSGYIYIDRIMAPIPLPPAMLLMLGGLGALVGLGWRRA